MNYYTDNTVVRVRSAKPNAINSRKNRAPPARAIFRDGKVSSFPTSVGVMSTGTGTDPHQKINPAVAAAMQTKAAAAEKA